MLLRKLAVPVQIDQRDVFAEHFFRSVAVQFLGALVPTGDVVIQVGGNHRVVDLVDDLGLLSQRLLRPLALGAILCCTHHPERLLLLPAYEFPPCVHISDRSIRPSDPEFIVVGFLSLESVAQRLFYCRAVFGVQ